MRGGVIVHFASGQDLVAFISYEIKNVCLFHCYAHSVAPF